MTTKLAHILRLYEQGLLDDSATYHAICALFDREQS